MAFRQFRDGRISAPMPLLADQLARAIPAVAEDDPLSRALYLFRREQVTALPVVRGGTLVGWVEEARLADAMAADADVSLLPVATLLAPPPAMLSPLSPPEEALAAFLSTGSSLLPITTLEGRYLACLARADILAAQTGRLTPLRVGGMATPLGVYLTSGTVSGGAGLPGLLLSGVLMATLLWLAQTVLLLGVAWLANHTGVIILRDVAQLMSGDVVSGSPWRQVSATLLTSGLLMGVFMLLMRFGPLLAGYHAAEHQTVHAIEQGEPLTVEAVRRMPRVHPRCGTNLWAIMSLCYLAVTILSFALTTKLAHEDIGIVISPAVVMVLVIAAQWRRIGGWLQQYITTRPATTRELLSGIRAGEEVLQRHQQVAYQPPNRFGRLWQMGLAQVLIGVMLAQYLLNLLDSRLDLLWQNLVK